MKTVSLPDRNLTVQFTDDKEVYAALTKCLAGDALGRAWYCDNVAVVAVFDGKLRTLVHELYHVIGYVNVRIGEGEACFFSEANAWLIDYLFEQLREGLV
jgi:hypothetical protein